MANENVMNEIQKAQAIARMNQYKKSTMTELLENLIVKAENGETLMATDLKMVCELCINSIAKYREQNRHGIAFEIIAKKHLTKEMVDLIEHDTQRLLELESKMEA